MDETGVASYEQPERIYLYKNIDDKYSYVQPYMYDGFFEGQESLMKYYFDIDQNAEIDWVEAVE